MTARELNRLKEQSRSRRKNLKRYLYTQSFSRLSDRDYPVSGGLPREQEYARSILGAVTAFILGTGLFFVVF